MQQNIFLRRDGNLSSHDVNFDEIIEEKGQRAECWVNRVNQQMEKYCLLIPRLTLFLPQCPFAFISPLRSTICFSFDLMLWKISF